MQKYKEKIYNLPLSCEINVTNEVNLGVIEDKLKTKDYKTKMQDNNLLLASKGTWQNLGAFIAHLGILILLIGCVMSMLTGFNGMAQISENEGFYLVDPEQNKRTDQIMSTEANTYLVPINRMPIYTGRVPPYLVKVNKTWRVDYETGQPKQWYTDLSIFDKDKKELKRKTIHVNNPVQFMGLDIYQSNWEKFAKVSFNGKNIALPLENFHGEEIAFLPLGEDVGLKFKLVEPYGRTAWKLEIYSISFSLKKGEIDKEKYLGKIDKDKNFRLGPLNIGFYGIQTVTGLQFKSNPGDFLIYLGLLLIIGGVFATFGSRKQIWVLADKNTEGSNKIFIGGNSNCARRDFAEEFKNLVLEIACVNKEKVLSSV